MYPTSNQAFDQAVLAAEGARQVATAAALSQGDLTAADLAYFTTVSAAATSAGIFAGQFQTALAEIRGRA